MKKSIFIAVVACVVATACTGPEGGVNATVGVEQAALNGVLTTKGNLTRLTFAQPDETKREAETQQYYQAVGVGSDGSAGLGTIASQLTHLSDFISFYGFTGNDPQASYYNRGDLGIGREMHCMDHLVQDGQIACYVKNFAAGDDNSEFSFGLSSTIAFQNMASQNSFATVAMVFRSKMNVTAANRVYFVVYDANGNLANAAALDRHALTFAKQLDPTVGGVPGVNFNLHVPSNCASCHGGGHYNSVSHNLIGSQFLPFDLDQFEYENAPGRTRSAQLTAFTKLNQIVRKVAAFSVSDRVAGASIKAQLDTWYNNQILTNDKTEVFENPFDSKHIPIGWRSGPVGEAVFATVVRPMCRNCHMALSNPLLRFESDFGTPNTTDFGFRNSAKSLSFANDLCLFQMPHSLQTVREFWLSPAPAAMESYLRAIGNTAAADVLRACGPGLVVTLDPPLILSGGMIL